MLSIKDTHTKGGLAADWRVCFCIQIVNASSDPAVFILHVESRPDWYLERRKWISYVNMYLDNSTIYHASVANHQSSIFFLELRITRRKKWHGQNVKKEFRTTFPVFRYTCDPAMRCRPPMGSPIAVGRVLSSDEHAIQYEARKDRAGISSSPVRHSYNNGPSTRVSPQEALLTLSILNHTPVR